MLKRILAASGTETDAAGPILWSVSLAKEHDASVTVFPVQDVSEWQRLRQTSPEGNSTLDPTQHPEYQPLLQAGLSYRGLEPQKDSMGALASLSRYQDMLLFGLGDCYSPSLVPDFTKAVSRLVQQTACPLLLTPPANREVKRVIIAYSGSTASARSFRRFVQSGLYADAEVDVVSLGSNLDDAYALLKPAEEYLHEHGRKVNLIALRGNEMQVVNHALDSKADLVVVGSNHRNALGIETSSQVLRAFLDQRTIPVFLSH